MTPMASSTYFLLRRWTRVRRSNLRCFFLAIRLRRFLTTEPMYCLYSLDVRQPVLAGDSRLGFRDDQRCSLPGGRKPSY